MFFYQLLTILNLYVQAIDRILIEVALREHLRNLVINPKLRNPDCFGYSWSSLHCS